MTGTMTPDWWLEMFPNKRRAMTDKPTPTAGTRMEFTGLRTEEYEALRAENKSLRELLERVMKQNVRLEWDYGNGWHDLVVAIRKALEERQ